MNKRRHCVYKIRKDTMIKKNKMLGFGQLSQLARALSQYTKVAGLIPVRAHTRINP